MADIAQVLAAGGMGIAGTAVGAGLTYWLGALNRRHQEEREDKTRWYDARFEAYSAMWNAVTPGVERAVIQTDFESTDRFLSNMANAYARIEFVGSHEAITTANQLFTVATREIQKARKDRQTFDNTAISDALAEFQAAARKDLGHPETP